MAQDETRQATKVLTAKCFELKTQGLSTIEIAEQLGCSRATVSRALNSKTGKELFDDARERIKTLISKAINVYDESLANSAKDMTNAQKAARDVLKNFGLLKDSIDISHSFPKPTVIKRLTDGSEVVLGAETPKEISEDSDEEK